MGHSHGLRSGTRYMFSRKFREHGAIRSSTFMHVYRVGDLVDIKANGAVQKGMPYKLYHGRTGVVYNVAPRALGIIVHKQVGNRMMEKRINVRIEHVQPSKCRDAFLTRVKENEVKRAEAKKAGLKVTLKRQPEGPRPAHFVTMKNNQPITVTPVAYEILI